MKKTGLSFICCLLVSGALFLSCEVETVRCYGNVFTYEDFLEYKNNWVEPQNYTFYYQYSMGDSGIFVDCVSIITDGNAVSTPDYRYYEKDYSYGDIRFNTIAQLYDYFDKLWKETPEPTKKNHYLSYDGSFKEKDGVVYPETLSQTWGIHNMYGYGGEDFYVKDFTLENHKTFLQKKEAWKEPNQPYSFSYWIYRNDENGKGTYSISVNVTVDAEGNGHSDIATQEENKAFFKEYGESLAEDYKLLSIAEVFEFIEKYWSMQEEKCNSSEIYGIIPIFEAKDSYKTYKIPLNFDCKSFFKKNNPNFKPEDSEIAKRFGISVFDFTLSN